MYTLYVQMVKNMIGHHQCIPNILIDFFCKLFEKYLQKENKLINEKFNDWIHAHVRLKEHENDGEHVNNICTWMDLRYRLETNKIIGIGV